MNKSFRLLLFFCVIAISSRVLSQTNGVLGNGFFSNWSVSLSGGPNIFYGDLKELKFLPATSPVNEIRFAGTFSLNRQLSHVFMLRAQVFYGEIAGEKRNYKNGSPCNQYFEGNIFEYNLNTTINFSNLILKSNPKRFFFVYGTIGAGFSNWNTKLKDLITHEQIGGSGTQKNWTTEIVIPAGLGAYFSIKDKVNLGVEWTLRGVNSDKLDATAGGFPYDAYSLLAFNLTYNFNKRTTNKLTSASYQKQIGPPPPRAALAGMIEAEKKKEEEGKTTKNNPEITSPVRDITRPGMRVPDTIQARLQVPDTVRIEEFTVDTVIPNVPTKGITYRVQVFAFRENMYSSGQVRDMLKLKQPVMKEFSGGWYRYTIGSFTNPDDARKLMTGLRLSKEVRDAFIAKYIDGKRANPAPPRTVKPSKYSKRKIYYHKPLRKK